MTDNEESPGHWPADAVRKVRWSKDLTQSDVAALIGRSAPYVSQRETDRTNEYSISELEILAREWKMYPLELIAGLSPEACRLVLMINRLEPSKQQLALRLFGECLKAADLVEELKTTPGAMVNSPLMTWRAMPAPSQARKLD